ncbi:MAG: GNAT family N-acetyltransferase [Chloroflexota bacterium]|nr:GNAT family N-acetyltransferase [Chloroflexota bacterium]
MIIRPATVDDQSLIRAWVRQVRLDPTALKWQHFLIAEDGGAVVGIGQIRPYPRCRELGSLVVAPERRGTGVGAQLVRALLASEPGPVYLECGGHNEAFYLRFGFRPIPWHQVPMPLKLKSGLGQLVGRLFGFRIVVMRWNR